MNYKVGDIVTRNSYNNDVIFKIISINGDIIYLQGVNLRLMADANAEDLLINNDVNIDDDEIIDRNLEYISIDRSSYFFIPGKILHIDGDSNYLDRCMNFYEKMGINANGICISEDNIQKKINNLLNEFKPDIVVVTGHDAYYSKKNDLYNLNNYQNTINFISAIKNARLYEKSHDKLIIIAGACQSNYEELIKAGATFASSPKRVNIHALDPAIIASSLAFSERNKSVNIIDIIKKTKYGCDGIGGIITNGTMYVGYPR